ncbi:MAG: oligosaccharide flippase family protein [Ignavibacteriales bacterium]|nr:oligosaccharide flippase family protein [Ignavibacteriales bacterium]
MLASLFRLLMILLSGGLVWFAFIQALEPILIAAGFVLVFTLRRESILKWRFNKDVAKRLFHDAWPLILASLAVSIYIRVGQIFITNMLSPEQNGYYAAAVRLCEAWYFIPMAISSSLLPAIVSAKGVSEELYKSRLQKLYDLLSFISIAIAVPVTIFQKRLLFSCWDKIPARSTCAHHLYLGGVGTFLGVASSQFLVIENFTKLAFLRTLVGLVLNIILNFLLIPKWG